MSDRIKRRDYDEEFFPLYRLLLGASNSRVIVYFLFFCSFLFYVYVCVSRFVVSCLNVYIYIFFAFNVCKNSIYKLFVVG